MCLYELNVVNAPEGPLSLFIKDVSTAFALYISPLKDSSLQPEYPYDFPKGEYRLLMSAGKINGTLAETIPQFLPQYVYFTPELKDFTLTALVANSQNDRGGLWNSPLLANARYMTEYIFRQNLLIFITLGILFYIFVDNLFFYFQRKKEKSRLLFSLLSGGLFIRQLCTERIFSQLFPDFLQAAYFFFYVKLELIVLYLLLGLFYLYVNRLFPGEAWKKAEKPLIGIITAGSFLTVFLPLQKALYLLPFFQILIPVVSAYCVFVFIRAVRKKREGSIIGFTGIVIFVAAVINDLLNATEYIQTAYISGPGFLIFILSQSFQLAYQYGQAISYVEILNQSLERFVPKQMLQVMGKKSIMDVSLGDFKEQNMTVLFSDIRGFTPLSESMSSDETFRFLNSYLSRIVPIIRKYNGYVDKFLGDGILALFPEKPADAVQAGREMIKELELYNAHRNSSGYSSIDIGIGIHTGDLILGTIGETERIEGTVIASVVNLASRLEELTKTYGTPIIISHEVKKQAEDLVDFNSRYLGKVKVRGCLQLEKIYEVIIRDPYKLDYLADFESIVQDFDNNELHLNNKLSILSKRYPEDKGLHYLLNLQKEL